MSFTLYFSRSRLTNDTSSRCKKITLIRENVYSFALCPEARMA